MVHVSAYTRSDGTFVSEHMRRKPNSKSSNTPSPTAFNSSPITVPQTIKQSLPQNDLSKIFTFNQTTQRNRNEDTRDRATKDRDIFFTSEGNKTFMTDDPTKLPPDASSMIYHRKFTGNEDGKLIMREDLFKEKIREKGIPNGSGRVASSKPEDLSEK